MEYLECKSLFDYYLSLEKDFFDTEYYIAFHEKNFKAFSIEFAKQLLSISSEVESVLKKICAELDQTKVYKNIDDYRACITEKFKFFENESVYFRNMHTTFCPWLSWGESKNPDWWRDYNQVKHKRAELDSAGDMNFFRSNLENVLNALAALYIAEEYLFYLCEKKYKYSENNQSYALENLRSDKLIMKDWMKSYKFFMGNKWCDLGVLDNLMEVRQEKPIEG